MLNRFLVRPACVLLFPMLLAAQQPAGHDPLAENLFPPELVMSHQKAIGLDEAQKTYIRGELLKAHPGSPSCSGSFKTPWKLWYRF